MQALSQLSYGPFKNRALWVTRVALRP
jgi:hypothetical protein